MKTSFLFLALATGAFAAPPVQGRITPAALAKIQQDNPIANLPKPQESTSQVARPAEQSIIKQSTILHDGTNWTLVPKGAVVFVPAARQSRMNASPVGTLLSWSEFLAKNVSWITTTSITFDQAAGNEPLPAESTAFWSKQDKVVIAVLQGGPVSVKIAEHPQSITQR